MSGAEGGTDGGVQPIRGDEGGTILGPRNEAVERLNPDMMVPPVTDSGTIPWMATFFGSKRSKPSGGRMTA